jgi:hypothetical protein
MRSEKLVAEAGEGGEGERDFMMYYSDICSVYLCEAVVVICS